MEPLLDVGSVIEQLDTIFERVQPQVRFAVDKRAVLKGLEAVRNAIGGRRPGGCHYHSKIGRVVNHLLFVLRQAEKNAPRIKFNELKAEIWRSMKPLLSRLKTYISDKRRSIGLFNILLKKLKPSSDGKTEGDNSNKMKVVNGLLNLSFWFRSCHERPDPFERAGT